MPNNQISNKSELSWEVEALRLTLFPSPREEVKKTDWWKILVGEVPEKSSELPRKGEIREEGPFWNGLLRLAIQATRIDWYLTINEKEREKQPTLGPFNKSLDIFKPLMLDWLPKAPEVQRLAFGAILLKPVKNVKEGYENLIPLLPNINLDPGSSSDFFYQINRPRDLKKLVEEIRINRLSKWSVESWNLVTFAMDDSGIGVSPGFENINCRLELDISTMPRTNYILPKEKLPLIFEELIELGKEISEKGDIP